MADYDSNMIKPVEGLHSITALTPAKRREERRQRKQFGQEDEEKKEKHINEAPLKRVGSPKEVAYTALFLASDESSFITGEIITVSGGIAMR